MAIVFVPQAWSGHPGRVPTLIATLGAPGCGKSTAVLGWLRAERSTRAVIGRDQLREMLDCLPVGDVAQEGIVTAMQEAGIRALLGLGVDVAVDDTNVQPGRLAHWASLAASCGAEFEVWDYTGVPEDVCQQRNAGRAAAGGRHVPPEVITRMHGMGLAARAAADAHVFASPAGTTA
jgi:predicted kinase